MRHFLIFMRCQNAYAHRPCACTHGHLLFHFNSRHPKHQTTNKRPELCTPLRQ